MDVSHCKPNLESTSTSTKNRLISTRRHVQPTKCSDSETDKAVISLGAKPKLASQEQDRRVFHAVDRIPQPSAGLTSSSGHRLANKDSTLSVFKGSWGPTMCETSGNKPERPRSDYRQKQSSGTFDARSRPGTARSRPGSHKVTLNNMTSESPDFTEVRSRTDDLTQQAPRCVLLPCDIGREKAKMIRPMSASYQALKSNRYLEERLRAMYSTRRASSAKSRATPILQRHHPVVNNNNRINSPEPQSDKPSQNISWRTNFSDLTPLAKFRTMANMAIYLRRLVHTIILNCTDNTMRSANELQWMNVYAEKHDSTLVFNKHLYSRDRVSTHVPDWALSILDNRPEDRTDQDLRRLHALLRGMKSFDKFTGEIQMFLCRAFTLERVAEGRVVLKSGHVGVNFYLIYSGSVFVNTEDYTKEGRMFMRTVAVLTRGESFGELALLQDIRRTATVSVRERCELLAVDKNVFASVCPRIFEKELAEKYAFLSSLDLFSTNYWSQESIRSLAMNAQIQEYKMNKVIVVDSSVEDWIYVCKEGRCHVIRCLSLDQPIKDVDTHRRMSEVVLSEEILQLLSSTGAHPGAGASHRDDNMRENLLSSLGLDYVQTGKKMYLGSDQAGKTILSGNETMTLTTFVKRYMENKAQEAVILSLGVIEAGQVFDLPSLLGENSGSETSSTLMLVSDGAKVVRVKKAAFFDQASQQAWDNTRTLASKRRNPSDESILESYKCEVAWDEFKSNLVQGVLRNKQLRYQPLHRDAAVPIDGKTNRLQRHTQDASHTKSSKIISALQRNRRRETNSTVILWSSTEESSDDETKEQANTGNRNTRSPSSGVIGLHYFDELKSSCQRETIIIRRHLARNRIRSRIVRNKDSLPRTSKYRK